MEKAKAIPKKRKKRNKEFSYWGDYNEENKKN